MKLIESKAELIPQLFGINGIYKQIELAGRTCYKSEDKITETSSKNFVERMIYSKHTAMLEHGTVYLKKEVDWSSDEYILFENFFRRNKYSEVNVVNKTIYVTTNYRVLVENDATVYTVYICAPTEFHKKRYTMKFITDRGVSHELVRHRVFSFAQESTRYCNYTKGKFGNELTFIIPSWYNNYTYSDKDFVDVLKNVEENYKAAIAAGATSQEARQILPNALKTEIVMTGFVDDWIHFFNLRWKGTTGKPHPDMAILAKKALEEFEKANVKEIIDII